jgi:Domain of unknown function (DUF4062)
MARPRIFVSSTYYDLKHLRSSLENFIESVGFDPILSEKGKIAYSSDVPLDESCYREVSTADIFVLIIGGRYGSEASGAKTSLPKTFYDRYNSITRGEYRSALDRDIPMYVLVERPVYVEYETYRENKANKTIKYAHVDSVNIFGLLEDILAQPRNNPIQQFDRYAEVESWLREQWAGTFRELLQRRQAQAQLASLQAQVSQLAEINKTLKTYLEQIVERIAPKEGHALIQAERARLEAAQVSAIVAGSHLGNYLQRSMGLTPEQIYAAVGADSFEDFLAYITSNAQDVVKAAVRTRDWTGRVRESVLGDLNLLRVPLGYPPLIDITSDEPNAIVSPPAAVPVVAKRKKKKATA